MSEHKKSTVSLLAYGFAGITMAAAVLCGCAEKGFTLAERGRAGACAIVLPKDASPSQKYAAQELQHYVKASTGVELPIAAEPGKGGAVRFVTDESLGPDAYRLTVGGDGLTIRGSAVHGCLFGVYGLLEDHVGVEWLASDCTNIPARTSIRLAGGLDRLEKPAFELRDLGAYDVTRNVDFAAHLRLHGRHFRFLERHGFDTVTMDGVLGNSHTFQRIAPVDRYFKDHPDWFSEVNGKRTEVRPQLCMSNPELLRHTIEFVKERMRRNPKIKYFGISQNDWPNHCTCPKCRAVTDREGSPSGPLVEFVNAVAREVAKTDPAVTLTTLAYQWSRKPPKTVRPERNVVVVLCDIECDFSTPLDRSRCEKNAKFMEDLRGWGRLTDRLYVWDYVVNYPHYPHVFADIPVLADNLRTFRANGASQVYEEADNEGPHAESAELKAWMLAHLMWNPDLDWRALRDRFIDGYYGAAARTVRTYYDELDRVAALRDESKVPLLCFEKIVDTPIPDEFYDRAAELWTKALGEAKGDARIERACRWGLFSADYSRVIRYLETDGRADGPGAARVVAAARRMVPLMDAEPATALAISKGHARYRQQRMIRELAARGFASDAPGEWTVPSWMMFLGSTAEYYRDVDDPDAIDGRAVDFTPKYGSSGLQLDFAKVRPTPPKGKLDVRIHMKVAKRAGVPGDAVVFHGMIDRGDVKRRVMEFSVRARDVKADGYAWYDVGSVDFDPSLRFWAGPSPHKGGPASDAVRFDAIRFVRPEGTVVFAKPFSDAAWKIDNYKERISIRRDANDPDGRKLLLKMSCPSGRVDTSWCVTSARFPIPAGSKGFELRFGVGGAPDVWRLVGTWRGGGRGNLVRWYDAAGRKIGYQHLSYAISRKELFRKRLQGPVPEGAAACEIAFGYDMPDLVDGQWIAFDDAEFRVFETPRPVTVDCEAPHFRLLTESPTEDVRAVLKFRVEDANDTDWGSLRLVVDGKDETANFRREGDVLSLEGRKEPWAPGIHAVEITACDSCGNQATVKRAFYIGKAPPAPKVTIRKDGVTLIDGKPFFPIGPYAVMKKPFNGNSFDRAFAGLKEGGFNFAHTYQAVRDPEYHAAAVKYGFPCMSEARNLFPDEKFLDELAGRENIIGWVIGDDTSVHQSPASVLACNDSIKAVDPNRLTINADGVSRMGEECSGYADYVNATDVLAMELYPVEYDLGHHSDSTCVAVIIRDMKRFANDVATFGDGSPKACWSIIQAFKGWGRWHHYPSRRQIYAMSFASIIHGAKGVTWYTYGGGGENEGFNSTPERWKDMTFLAKFIGELVPALVEPECAQPGPAEIVSGPKTDPLGFGSVSMLLKRHGGESYLLTVNSSPEKVRARIRLEGVGGTAAVLHEKRTVRIADGAFEDDFKPFAVHVYRFGN